MSRRLRCGSERAEIQTGADGFFTTIRASVALSSASAVNRSDDVVSSAASRLAVASFVFSLVVIDPSSDVQCVK